MECRPVERRFGYGVARIPIGRPTDSAPLAACARIPRRYERRLASMPVLMAIALAYLVVRSFAPDAHEPIGLAAEAPLELEYWSESRPTPPALPADPSISKPVTRVAEPEQTVNAPTRIAVAEPSTERLDARSLTLTAPRTLPPALAMSEPPHHEAQARPDARRPKANGGRDQRARVARAARSRAAQARAPMPILADTSAGSTRSPARRSRPALPSANEGHAPSFAARAGGDGPLRQAFLSGLGEEIGATTVRSGPRRPPVSAAFRVTSDRVRSAVARHAAQAGWQEIPLDDLPACTPPERQDALKRQILRLAPSGRECRSGRGHFRFLETRNLNAFLLWSRSESTRQQPLAARPQGDACAVLERALACLGAADPSTSTPGSTASPLSHPLTEELGNR